MEDSDVNQLCQCACGAARFTIRGRALLRVLCHCTICQSFNRKPYADVTIFEARAVTLPEKDRVVFRTYRPPPAVQRGRCSACDGAAITFARIPLSPKLAVIPSANFADNTFLPEPSLHIFYDRRVADVEDNLPRYSGYWRSQVAFGRCLISAVFRGKRSA